MKFIKVVRMGGIDCMISVDHIVSITATVLHSHDGDTDACVIKDTNGDSYTVCDSYENTVAKLTSNAGIIEA